MNQTEIALLFNYNRWANARVLAACRGLSPQQLTTPAQTSFGSLMGTLAHIFSAERTWRLRLQEHISPERLATVQDFESLDALTAAWQAEEASMQAFVEGLDPSELESWVEYTTTSGKTQGSTLWRALLHVIIHGAQFRGEVGAVLAGLGRSPGDLDFILYLRESDQR